ncbi:HEAT repeat-containing protein 1 [Caerostris darwini]|uniref:HEAT repeat-containing protein 1 n=1 Tax=Caerostris darwini TaxID=1538125 RepID=A0AAV4PHK0_9ARAC|nr:HEAT repeat-containing protein 1 [Caerostris darwini]
MSGETALARQLKKLAVPQASLPVQDKCRKSFMFDSRDAAALDKDTFFVVGKSGLSKLVQGNPIFAKFESNLFHDIYKDVERSMETANINKKLDEMITDFLRLLSPYFVTTPAHEALEWLVYRFQIHLYNADELVASALPHYSTSSFVLVVQLLNLDDPNSRWAWLLPIKKSGVPLQYSAIVNHFNADGGFKKFVCNLAPNSLKAFNTCQLVATPIVTFSMLTIYTALNVSKTITDNMITFLFPYILKGIKSDFTQYVALSYTIITKIIQNVKLTDVILMDLLVNVFKNDELIKDAFKLLTLIYQQQSLSKMDLEFFKLMISKKECLEELIYISKNYDATLLKAAIIKRAIPFLFGLKLRIPDSVKCKKAFRFCTNFLNSVDLTAEEVSLAFNVICDKYVKFSVESNLNMKLMDETAKVILKSLETNYPEYFDKAVNSYFKKKTKDGKVKKQLCRLINDSICNLKNKIISDIQTSLVLGINHANVHIRKSSAKYLLEQAASGEVSDESFIESSLCDRLSDDSPSVVMEILSSPKVLFDYIEKKKLLDRFDHIFKKKLPEWSKVQMRCLNIMCKYYVDERYLAFEIFSTLLPFIFPLRKNSIKIFYRIMDSKLKSFLPIFQVLVLPDPTTYSEENSEELLKGINFMIISSIKKYVDQLDSSSQSLFLSFLMKKSLNEFNFAIAVIFVIAAGHVIISNDQLNEKLSWLDHLLKFFKSMSNKNIIYDTFSVEMNEEALIEKYVKVLREQQFPGLVFCTTFHKIINFIKLNFCITDKTWLLGEGDIQFTSFKILILLFKFCVEQYNSKRSSANNFKHLLEQFLHSQFSTTENCFNFLSLLWSNAYNVCVPDIQEAAVVSALSFCDNSNSYQWFFDNYQVCICLLKAIADPHTAVRGKSLLLLSSLLQQSKKHNSPLRSLSEYICERSDEITIDSHQCFFVINKYLSFNVCDSQNQSIILDSLLNILKDDKSPNSIKHFILLCLQKMNNVDILTALIPVIDKFLVVVKNIEVSADESHEKENTVRNILQLLLEKFTPESAKCLIENSIETKTFFECLQLVKDNSVEKYDGIQFVLYKQLTKDFFTAIPSVIIQKELLEFLLNVYLSSTSEVSIHIKKILQKLSTYAYLILKDFQKMKCSQKNTTLRDLKRLKLREENLQIFEDEYWKKIIVLLELIQNKSKLEKRKELIPELFNLLNQTMSFDSYASVEYVKQLILSTIHNCCQHLENGELDERQFQVELIVQCIRCSSNPSTHHQSLLLLNLAAKMFPNYVLNNVMSIFTFMGSSLVRQDDSYSFQVISQTIETIVPSLLAASSYQKDNEAIQIVASVIRVFVDSLSDIPQHRQLPLFSKLISTLGSSEYLWIPLAQICDQYATVFHNISDNVSKVSLF